MLIGFSEFCFSAIHSLISKESFPLGELKRTMTGLLDSYAHLSAAAA